MKAQRFDRFKMDEFTSDVIKIFKLTNFWVKLDCFVKKGFFTQAIPKL